MTASVPRASMLPSDVFGNGRLAVSISYSTNPKANRSVPVDTFPSTCSGAMYAGVPANLPTPVSD
jgi:hypothetical protein